MTPKKLKSFIPIFLVLIVFSFVLFSLIFKFMGDMESESTREKVAQAEKQRSKAQFMKNLDEQYERMQKLYQKKEYEKAIRIIKLFNRYGKSNYKDMEKIKKDIRFLYLKEKLDFIPDILFEYYVNFSKDIEIEEDNSTQVFIRTPLTGHYFYPSDFPILLEGAALAVAGDFSDDIIWTSSIDGALGKGKKLSVRLSFGEHQITATSTNGRTTGTMDILIHVNREVK